MNPIVPAIMPRKLFELKEGASLVRQAVDMIQIDIMDGHFVSRRTWPYPLRSDSDVENILPDGLPYWEEVDYELDLMIDSPEDSLPLWRALGPSAIVIHYESVSNWEELITFIEETKDFVSFGLSFDDETDKSLIEEKLEHFSYLQCMGIDEIGAQGQPFSEKVLANIKYFKEKYPELMITVDGSVNFNTIKDLQEAGATRFVAGSAVYNHDNPAYQVEALAGLLE